MPMPVFPRGLPFLRAGWLGTQFTCYSYLLSSTQTILDITPGLWCPWEEGQLVAGMHLLAWTTFSFVTADKSGELCAFWRMTFFLPVPAVYICNAGKKLRAPLWACVQRQGSGTASCEMAVYGRPCLTQNAKHLCSRGWTYPNTWDIITLINRDTAHSLSFISIA